MKRNILIGVSIAMLLIALAVTIVSNGTYSTNTVSISCGEVSDTTMYVGNAKKITVTIKDTDNNDITSDYSDASFGWEIEDTSIASITENITGYNFNEINNSINTTNTNLKLSVNSLEQTADEIRTALKLSVDNILNMLSATLRPEPNSVNKYNQIINDYTWK